MQGKKTGVFHPVYCAIILALFLVGLVFGGRPVPNMDQTFQATLAISAFALMPVTIFFWILAALNVAIIRGRDERRDWKERQEMVILLYELACEFLQRFATHYILVAADSPEKNGNRRNLWLAITHFVIIANQVEMLGDNRRSRKLRDLLWKQLTDIRVDIDDGGEWAKLKIAIQPILFEGKVSLESAPVDFLTAVRQTRLADYLLTFGADSG